MAQARVKAASLPVIISTNVDINIQLCGQWTMDNEQNTEC